MQLWVSVAEWSGSRAIVLRYLARTQTDLETSNNLVKVKTIKWHQVSVELDKSAMLAVESTPVSME